MNAGRKRQIEVGQFQSNADRVARGVEHTVHHSLRWPPDFGPGDNLIPLERETGRYEQGDTEALRG